jgi:hypothetical protein
MLEQEAWNAEKSPPCTKYSPDHSHNSLKPRSLIANMDRDKSKREVKLHCAANPSPQDYKDKDVNWKHTMSTVDRVPNYTIPKVKEFRFWDSHLKSKKHMPGVGTHDSYDMAKHDKLSKGPSPRYKTGR